MRAKFKIDNLSVWRDSVGLTLEASPVGADVYGPNGENEDNIFARYTPFGRLVMSITNPELVDVFQIGEKYYLDFTKAE